MDLIRYSLIGAIVLVGLVIAREWPAFKAEHTPIAQLSSQAIASNTPALAIESSEEIPTIAGEGLETIPATIDKASYSGLISITTDVLNLTIDTIGGDIVEASLTKYLATLGEDDPFIILERSAQRTYIAQSGLIGPNGTDTSAGRPRFSSAKQSYVMQDGEDTLVVDLLFTDSEGTQITKRFSLQRGNYLVNQDYIINNRGVSDWQATFYTQLKRDNSIDPGADTSGMGMKPFLGVATTTADKPYKKISFSDLADEPLKATVTDGWVAMVQHYFISAWIAPKGETNEYSTKVTSNGFNLIRYTGPAINLAPGETDTINSRFYVGPKDQEILADIAKGLDLTVDYGFLWWIAQPLFMVLTWIQGIVGNWGFSIILLTVCVKAAFYKLSAASYRSMAKMRLVTPKMTAIRERHADDKQAQSQAMMELYKKEKVNPLGGCLPIVIQMPVFISLYWVLMESVEIRHAPWLGWIQDLASMDPYFILPLIMGASMFFQQRLNPTPPDPMQAKIMQWMPVAFTFFFLWFPAGLVLYWVTNNLLSILQQWYITRQIEQAQKTD
ncbi:MAG: membrane protein insertase YidC [Pseudomonadales bacterium]